MARRVPRAAATGGALRTRSEPVPHSRLVFLPADWLPVALVVGDSLIVAFSVLMAYWLRYGTTLGQVLPLEPYLVAVPIVVAIYLFALTVNGQYRSWRGRALVDRLLGLYSGIALAAILMLAAIEVVNLGAAYSRFTFIVAVLLSTVLMTGERYLLREYETRLRRAGIGTERVLIVGAGAGSERLIQRMSMFPQYGFKVAGVVDDELAVGSPFAGAEVVGDTSHLRSQVRRLHVDQVFLALPTSERNRLPELIKVCEDEQIEFKILPDLLEVMTTRVDANAIDGLPLIGVRRNRLDGSAAAVKRSIDVAVSAALLMLASPVMLVVALLIKLAMPGEVFFRQERIGRDRKPFVIYKFRSMIQDAEAETGPVVARPGDSRVTGLGKVLRRTSLDELPQLINVLKGDMSLVGPRPQPTFFDQRYSREVPRYLERQQVRPGLTGWAEVNDLRGAAPISDRTLYDVYYIENWSLALDLKIVILTGLRFLSQNHAY